MTHDKDDNKHNRKHNRNHHSLRSSNRYNSRYGRYDSRFGRYDSRFGRYDSRFGRYDSRYGRYDSRCDRYDKYDSGYGRYDSRYDAQQNRYDRDNGRNIESRDHVNSNSNSNRSRKRGRYNDQLPRYKHIHDDRELVRSRQNKRSRDSSPKRDPNKTSKSEGNSPPKNNGENSGENPSGNPGENIISFIRLIPPSGFPPSGFPPSGSFPNLFEESTPKDPDNDPEDEYFNSDQIDEYVQREINTIDDLIELGKLYDPVKKTRYNINVYRLHKLIEPLTQLKNMIGMESVKKGIVDLVVYYLQQFETQNSDMLHTVIYGSPGCGKTEVAHIMAKIYSRMGVVKYDKVHTVKRSDLIGKYLGHTANLTQKAINSALDGILFIDEAYSLGNPEGRDSYSKECIDTINQNLTENKNKFICIIAGYKEDLEKSFFAYNKGLERRFPFRYTIDEYVAEDLYRIFNKMVDEAGWKSKDIPLKFFEKNRDYFKFNGGDMETLFHLCKISHARRVFCLDKSVKKIITMDDLNRAFEMFLNDNKIKNRNERVEHHLYL